VQVGRDGKDGSFGAGEAERHVHRLGRRRRLVEQRRVGDRHAGQVAHHGLEIQQRLQPSLRQLRLIGRVGGVPARVLQHVALDHRRDMGAVIALSDQRFLPRVQRRQRAQLREHARLVHRRRQLGGGRPDGGRHRAIGQIIQRRGADHRQHGRNIGLRRADMATGKTRAALQRREAGETRETRVHHSVSRNAA
jgi:hypothetical protein